MRLLATCQYIGTKYYGWQKQKGQYGIQEIIENVISQILNEPIKIYASGRTDAQVHALGQTFHFDVNKKVVLGKLKYSINCLLPKDIQLTDLKKVDDNFHARYDVKEKRYLYLIHLGSANVFMKEYVEEVYDPFDLDLFKESLNLFIGKHNFKNFTSKEEDEKDFIRTIFSIDVEIKKDIINITLSGDGFMRYMIRYIIGTCINIATKKISIDYINQALDSDKERAICSYKSQAKGLFLEEVIY